MDIQQALKDLPEAFEPLWETREEVISDPAEYLLEKGHLPFSQVLAELIDVVVGTVTSWELEGDRDCYCFDLSYDDYKASTRFLRKYRKYLADDGSKRMKTLMFECQSKANREQAYWAVSREGEE